MLIASYAALLFGRGGTFAPERRAFDNPIAIACLAFLCSPRLRWRISVSTSFCALGPYLRRELLFVFDEDERADERDFDDEDRDFDRACDVRRCDAELRDDLAGEELLEDLLLLFDRRALARGDLRALREVVPFASILFSLAAMLPARTFMRAHIKFSEA